MTNEPEATSLRGKLHISVAFDWGEEIDLVAAAALVPSEVQSLPRRRRTPPSIHYHSPPLLVKLAAVAIDLPEIGQVEASCDATVFDFGAVNVVFRIPFQLTKDQVSSLADFLAEPAALIESARAAATPLHEKFRRAIKNPAWCDLTEEYFVFQFEPGSIPGPSFHQFVDDSAEWLAGILRLDSSPLAEEEVAEALKRRIAYTPTDLVIVEWAAAIVIDEACADTLQTIEFANAQLLEFRYIDRRCDATLTEAYGLIHPLAQSRLPFWGLQSQPLRVLGDLRIDAVVLFSRTGNALKLVGDQYLARLYRMLSEQFHLEEWTRGIQESLHEAQGVYEILHEEAAAARTELLEIIVVLLILIEILLSIFAH